MNSIGWRSLAWEQIPRNEMLRLSADLLDGSRRSQTPGLGAGLPRRGEADRVLRGRCPQVGRRLEQTASAERRRPRSVWCLHTRQRRRVRRGRGPPNAPNGSDAEHPADEPHPHHQRGSREVAARIATGRVRPVDHRGSSRAGATRCPAGSRRGRALLHRAGGPAPQGGHAKRIRNVRESLDSSVALRL